MTFKKNLPSPVWTAEEEALLLPWISKKCPGAIQADIAARIGRSANSVQLRLCVLRMRFAEERRATLKPKPETFARECLACQKPFKAASRYIRRCGCNRWDDDALEISPPSLSGPRL